MHATRAAQLTALTQNRGRAVFQRKLCLEFDGSARHAGSYAPSRRSAFNQGNHASVWAGTPQPLRAADHTPNTDRGLEEDGHSPCRWAQATT
jgi:hypothetical protein